MRKQNDWENRGENVRKSLSLGLVLLTAVVLAQSASAVPTWDRNPSDFEHGFAVEVEGELYYFLGPGSIQGRTDVPGHTWIQAEDDPYQVVGRHYNVGPWMAGTAPWWANGEPYGVFLFQVHGIIGPAPADLDVDTTRTLKARGYVHFHELVSVDTGEVVESPVVYLKHTAVRSFNFDGGPRPDLAHVVSPGIDYEFMPNW